MSVFRRLQQKSTATAKAVVKKAESTKSDSSVVDQPKSSTNPAAELDDDVYKMLENQNARMRLQIELQSKEVLEAQREVNALKKKLASRDAQIDDLQSEALKWRQWVRQKSTKVLENAKTEVRATAFDKSQKQVVASTQSVLKQEDSEAESKAEAAAAESEHLREEVRLLRAALAEERSAARAAGLSTGSSVLWDDDDSITGESSHQQ